MKAFVFPGQGAQFPGMGKDLYESNPKAKELFDKANEILGFEITKIMFEGTAEELKQTKVTQPAVFLHSVISAICLGDAFDAEMVGGHSLGEFSALVAAGALTFEDGLKLVSQRAQAMQKACEAAPSTMAAIIGLDGAKRALPLPVGGAFHSPLMQPAKDELQAAIEATTFSTPRIPVYQNVDAKAHTDAEEIKQNLIAQLTAPVKWTYEVQQMLKDGATDFVECGPGKALQGMILKIAKGIEGITISGIA